MSVFDKTVVFGGFLHKTVVFGGFALFHRVLIGVWTRKITGFSGFGCQKRSKVVKSAILTVKEAGF